MQLNDAARICYSGLPPGVRPKDVEPRTSWTDDASSEELWDALTDDQQQKIKDSFLEHFAADMLGDIIGTRLVGAMYTWERHRDEELEKLVMAGEIK